VNLLTPTRCVPLGCERCSDVGDTVKDQHDHRQDQAGNRDGSDSTLPDASNDNRIHEVEDAVSHQRESEW
jgi:hypothetical protein